MKHDTFSRYLRTTLAMILVAAVPHGWAQPQPVQAQAAQPATSATLDRIRASGKLVLGYYTQAKPMSYRDASGNAAGYAVALCRQVADEVKAELGLQKLALEWVPLTPATGMPAVRQGKVDLLCGAEVASLKSRENVSFSLPLFPGGISALVRADSSKAFQNALEERPVPYRPIWRASPFSPLQHKTASVIAGTPAVDLLKKGVARRHLIGKMDLVDSHEAGIANVLSRDSDVFFGDRATLLAQVRHSADAGKLRVLTRRYTYEALALALPRNDDDFRLVVDRGLIRFYASPQFGDAYTEAFGPPDADTVEYFRGIPR